MEVERISKLDAACRQLNTAISLWFYNGDSVSIHNLVCSAHQIIHDINRKKGGRDLIYDSLLVKEEYRHEVNKIFKKPYNFFKHANNDADGTLEFKQDLTEFFMLFTSIGLEILGRKPDEIRSAFNIYYMLCNPQILTEKGKSNFTDKIPEEVRRDALSMSRKQFFEFYIKLRKMHLSNA